MGLWSLWKDLMESVLQGLLRKLRWGPRRTLGSGIFEGWGQAGRPKDSRVQMAQDCYPLARLHSPDLHPDLHPWPHRTGLRLRVEKERGKGSNITEKTPKHWLTPREIKITHGTSYSCCGFVWHWSVCRYWEWINCTKDLCHARCCKCVFKWCHMLELTCFSRPFCSIEVGDVASWAIPGSCGRLPRRRRTAGNWLSHPRRICSGDGGAALCRYRGVCYIKGIHLCDASLQGMTRLILHKYISPQRLTFLLISFNFHWNGGKRMSLSPKESHGSVAPMWPAAWFWAVHRWSLGGCSTGTANTSTRSMKAVWSQRKQKTTIWVASSPVDSSLVWCAFLHSFLHTELTL